MYDVTIRRKIIEEELLKEKDAKKKEVLNRLFQLVNANGIYELSEQDIFEKNDELRHDEDFIKKCIELYPPTYCYIAPELQGEEKILFALATAPICVYHGKNIVGYKITSPLIFAHNRYDKLHERKISTETISELSELQDKIDKNKECSKPWSMFSYKKNLSVFSALNESGIENVEIMLKAFESEINSYEYCKAMAKKADFLNYKGLDTLDKIKSGGIIIQLDSFLSLSHATDAIFYKSNFLKRAEDLLQNWKESQLRKEQTIAK